MSKKAALRSLATLAGVAVIAVAFAIALALWTKPPSATALGYPAYAGAQPAGCHAVAPGAWSAFCDTNAGPTNRPSSGGELVCVPVAPGAFTEICTKR
jgi:invasion protein IalB